VPLLRHVIAVGMAALCLCGGGCTLVRDATSLTAFKVKESMEDCYENVRNRKWAEQAWNNVLCSNPEAVYSSDHKAGFQDGFANYLFRGGNGEPPPLPPRHYRTIAYQTSKGYRSIEDWFEGYRHGSTVAREGGYRQWVTGPSALRGSGPVQSPLSGQAPVILPPEALTEPPPNQLGDPQPLDAELPTTLLPGPRLRARIVGVRALGPIVQPDS
jgi:hypothetical protein